MDSPNSDDGFLTTNPCGPPARRRCFSTGTRPKARTPVRCSIWSPERKPRSMFSTSSTIAAASAEAAKKISTRSCSFFGSEGFSGTTAFRQDARIRLLSDEVRLRRDFLEARQELLQQRLVGVRLALQRTQLHLRRVRLAEPALQLLGAPLQRRFARAPRPPRFPASARPC